MDFDDVLEEPDCVRIRSPGLGDFWLEREHINLDAAERERRGGGGGRESLG